MAQCEHLCDPRIWAVPTWRCRTEAALGDNLCLLHGRADWKDRSPKEYSDDDKQQRDAFESLIEHRLEKPEAAVDLEEEPRRLADLSGIVFPHEFRLLKGRKIKTAISFAGAQFRYEVSFRGTTFREDVVFEEAVFPGAADFHGARFRAGAVFKDAVFAMVAFDGARFMSANFDNSGFHLDASFLGAHFRKAASFHRAIFSGSATFDKSIFEQNARFVEATFGETASFQLVRFDGRVDFPERRPPGFLVGIRRRVTDPVEESGDNADPPIPAGFFHLLRLYGAIFANADSGEEAFRKAKLIHRSRGDYFRAGYCYRLERHHTNRRLPWFLRRFPWVSVGKLLDRVLGGWLCGWGEQPWKVLFASVMLIALFGLVFSLDPNSLSQDPGITEASDQFRERDWWPDRLRIGIYFSGVTFPTLGYGDYHPRGAYGMLAIAEALIGAALMSLFVVCVARKLMH